MTTPPSPLRIAPAAARFAVAAALAFTAFGAAAQAAPASGPSPAPVLPAASVVAQTASPVTPASAPVHLSAPKAKPGFASSGPNGWALSSGGPSWKEITPAQQQVLSPLAGEWNGLDATGKQKWLEVATRFPRMTPDDQQRVRARMVEWVHMTPQQRSTARLVFQENRDVSREQRQALWQQYQALPDDKKRELAQKEIARRTAPAASGPASATAAVARSAPSLDASASPKSNVVRNPNPATLAPRPVAPVIVQARPGATTTLVNKTPVPPTHQKDGGPKIAVGAADVDRTTLLPRRGPQHVGPAASGAAIAPAAPSHPRLPAAGATTPAPVASGASR